MARLPPPAIKTYSIESCRSPSVLLLLDPYFLLRRFYRHIQSFHPCFEAEEAIAFIVPCLVNAIDLHDRFLLLFCLPANLHRLDNKAFFLPFTLLNQAADFRSHPLCFPFPSGIPIFVNSIPISSSVIPVHTKISVTRQYSVFVSLS